MKFQRGTHAYIGINADGEVRAVVFDDPGYEKDTAKRVAEWIKMGRTVERVDTETALQRMNPERAKSTATGSAR